MSRGKIAIVLVCLLSMMAAYCTVQACLIWEGSGEGSVPASFEEGPPTSFVPTDSDPQPDMEWEPETPYRSPPKERTGVEWSVVQELPDEPWWFLNRGSEGTDGPAGDTPSEESTEDAPQEETTEEGVPTTEEPGDEPDPDPEEPEDEPWYPQLIETGPGPTGEDSPLIPSNPLPSMVELETLAELEGERDFSRSTCPWRAWGRGQGQGQGLGQGGGSNTAPGGIGSGDYEKDGTPDGETDPMLPGEGRDVEESDIVKLRDDILYVLNPYRGLVIVDLSDPDEPEVIGTEPVLGTPVDMYVVGDMVYIVVATDYGFWYSYATYGQAQGVGSAAGEVLCSIGSKLVIVDVADPSDPELLLDMPIEGLITDSRRVGQVIYYVTEFNSWYNQYEGTRWEDHTRVVSVNVMDPRNVVLVDQTFFKGESYVTHASNEYLFVSQWTPLQDRSDTNWRNGWTDIIIVDISDPMGSILRLDKFGFHGRVWDKYQMDQFGDTFRVVARTEVPLGSRLLTFDISSPDETKALGSLVIDDLGVLMATRFAGERAYTIHLPVRIDPLEVIDLSDPSDPRLCDVFEMPGWVTHMEVRGMNIIAIGVDDSGRTRNVAVSLFDVRDPYNTVMLDRVRIGANGATSEAITEPKALTVLDEQGLVLVPYESSHRDGSGRWTYFKGVQIVSFDLAAGDLVPRGAFEQDSRVLRTRGIGDHVVSTSNEGLVVADISDPDDPRVTASLGFCRDVVGFYSFSGRYVEITYDPGYDIYCDGCYYARYQLSVFAQGMSDLQSPLWQLELGNHIERYYWDGRYLHTVDEEMVRCPFNDLAPATSGYERVITATTYDLLGDGPEPVSRQAVNTGDYYDTYVGRCYPGYGNGQGYGQGASSVLGVGSCSYYGFEISNPVWLDGGYIAFYTRGDLWVVDVGRHRGDVPVTNIKVDRDGFIGLLPAGRGLFVVNGTTEWVQLDDEHDLSMASYYVTPVTMDGYGSYEVGGCIQVPGMPVGSSDDGRLLYSVCSWYRGGTEDWLTTLNVVSIEDGRATITWAVPVDRYNLWLDGDTAFIIETVYTEVPDGMGTGGYSCSRNIYIVDLATQSLQWATVTDGDVYLVHFGEGLAILGRHSRSQMVLIDFQEPSDITCHDWNLARYVVSIHRCESVVYVNMGRYGVVQLDI